MYDYRGLDTTVSVSGTGIIPSFVVPFETYQDGVREGAEGLVLYLDIDESELDPRDVGEVSLDRSFYLVRITELGMCTIAQLKTWQVDNDSVHCLTITVMLN